MAFRDLDEFLHVEPLELPIRGKVYAFPGEISARSLLALQRLYAQQIQALQGGDVDAVTVTAAEQDAIDAEMWGAVKDEMLADGLTSTHIDVVARTLVTYHLMGRDAAEAGWNGLGEPPAPSRATRRSRTPAKSTRPRGSRAGSSAPRSKTQAAKSAGTRSSDTGA